MVLQVSQGRPRVRTGQRRAHTEVMALRTVTTGSASSARTRPAARYSSSPQCTDRHFPGRQPAVVTVVYLNAVYLNVVSLNAVYLNVGP